MQRIGIMGGTFDPVHYGHLVTAEEAYHRFRLDKVVFVPSAHPPHKLDKVITSPAHRYMMTVLATMSNPHFEVSSSKSTGPVLLTQLTPLLLSGRITRTTQRSTSSPEQTRSWKCSAGRTRPHSFACAISWRRHVRGTSSPTAKSPKYSENMRREFTSSKFRLSPSRPPTSVRVFGKGAL